ncbi:retrovirus-related pol polyprotein from transposon TNT 1-94 [Tanacetum coccineum]
MERTEVTNPEMYQTFLESEFLLFKLDLTFLDWTFTLFFSLLLGVREILSFFVFPEGFDPLTLVKGFTPVEDNRGTGGNYSGKQRVVKCFNCQREGHMARQCPKPKRKRDATWFRDKVLLVEAQRNCKVLNEEELEFLANPGIAEAKAVLMANLSSCGLDVLSKVSHSDNTRNDMLNQSLKEMPYFEQTHLVNYPENKITNKPLDEWWMSKHLDTVLMDKKLQEVWIDK